MKIVLSKKIKSLPKHFWILLAIILLGVFLRTYHFSDWLKFNSDQARDASVVRDMLEKGELPLLGPVAGGTFFQLGPAFYYFQYAGAKIFGNTPDKLAYADLFFGISAIFLLYLLARQYFHKNISLVLTVLYACAFFTVQYSRFAWNPNSAQFFSLLFFYSIVRLWNDQSNRKWLWLVLAGISLGIGMQLHTLLLFGMPFALFFLAAYLWKNKRIKLVGVGGIIFVAVLLNSTQIISEIKTGGTNYWEFKQALLKKSGNQNPLWKNALFIVSCQAQANIKILAPQANQENCDFPLADKYFKRLKSNMQDFSDWLSYGGKIIVVALFLVSSYGLMYRKRKKDGDGPAVLLLLFNLALLFVFVPFGAEISLRYFILLAFVPFLLLGACLEFVLEKFQPRLKFWMLVGIFALITYNVYFCFLTFHAQANNLPGNTVDGTAIQAEAMADYMIEKSGFAKKIQIGGQKLNTGRFYNRMAYFAKNKKENWWKYLGIIILICVIFYLPVILSDLQSNGNNALNFLKSFGQKSSGSVHFLEALTKDIFVFSKYFLVILTGVVDASKQAINWFIFALFLFFGSGIFLFKTEKNAERKFFIALVFVWFFSYFVTYFPLGSKLQPRHFLTILPLPFIFFGFMVCGAKKISKFKWMPYIAIAILLIPIMTNAYSVNTWFSEIAESQIKISKHRKSALLKSVGGESWWHLEKLARFMHTDCDQENIVIVPPKQSYRSLLDYAMRSVGEKKAWSIRWGSIVASPATCFYVISFSKNDISDRFGKQIEEVRLKQFGDMSIRRFEFSDEVLFGEIKNPFKKSKSGELPSFEILGTIPASTPDSENDLASEVLIDEESNAASEDGSEDSSKEGNDVLIEDVVVEADDEAIDTALDGVISEDSGTAQDKSLKVLVENVGRKNRIFWKDLFEN